MPTAALNSLIQKAEHDFTGGLVLPGFKELSLGTSEQPVPITEAPVPKRLAIPLSQHIGTAATAIVKVGDRVLKGQRIAKPDGYISAPVHASSSGTVVAIHQHPVPHPSGLTAPCIILETDGLDEAIPVQYVEDYNIMDPSHLRNVIRQAGIVGLGGAAFPSNVKLNPGRDRQVDTLILNGAECEPYITCDEALMRYKAANIVAGIDIMQRAVNAQQVLIGIGDAMRPEAEALAAAITKAGRTDTRVVMVPTRYPKGGEKQLIQSLTGLEVPRNGLPIDIGIICQNVGTAAAIYRAVALGEPLVSRVVTVTGPGIRTPQNLRVRIGTPVRDLIEFCGGYTNDIERLIMGGPMMGYALHNDQVPVVKSTNCILGAGKADLPDYSQEMPCIRCGSCADVCPASLLPQQLYWHAKAQEFDRVQDYNLFDCIECGCCSAVCPSHIPLVQYYRHAKGEIWKNESEQRKADQARERHEFRQTRMEREEAEKAARQAAKKAALKPKASTTDQDTATEGAKPAPAQDAIAAAIARAKAKKSGATDAATKAPSPAQAAIAAAKAKSQSQTQDLDAADTAAPLSPPQLAIQKAKQLANTAANEAETTEKEPAKKTLSATELAILKAKKAKAKTADPDTDIGTSAANTTQPKTALSPAEIAILKAQKAQANTDKADAPIAAKPTAKPKLSAAEIAILKAKKQAKQQAGQQTEQTASGTASASDNAPATKSPAQLAIERAQAAAQQGETEGKS